jgi:hypothetical protein
MHVGKELRKSYIMVGTLQLGVPESGLQPPAPKRDANYPEQNEEQFWNDGFNLPADQFGQVELKFRNPGSAGAELHPVQDREGESRNRQFQNQLDWEFYSHA